MRTNQFILTLLLSLGALLNGHKALADNPVHFDEVPEAEILKAYENCLLTSQGDLWVNLLKNLYPEPSALELVNESVLFQRISRPVIGRDHLDLQYRLVFSDGGRNTQAGLDFRLEPKDGTLKLKVRSGRDIEIKEFKIPFFKFDRENRKFEVLGRMGEVQEYNLPMAQDANLRTYEGSAPAVFKNDKTNRSFADVSGNLFQFDRAKYLQCISKQVSKGQENYSIMGTNAHSSDRNGYIQRLRDLSRTYDHYIEGNDARAVWYPVQTGTSTGR